MNYTIPSEEVLHTLLDSILRSVGLADRAKSAGHSATHYYLPVTHYWNHTHAVSPPSDSEASAGGGSLAATVDVALNEQQVTG